MIHACSGVNADRSIQYAAATSANCCVRFAAHAHLQQLIYCISELFVVVYEDTRKLLGAYLLQGVRIQKPGGLDAAVRLILS